VFQIVAMDANPVPKPTMVAMLDLGAGERIDAVVEMNTLGIWILGSTDAEVREKGLGIVVEYEECQGEPVWSDVAEQEWDYTIVGDLPRQPEGEQISITIARLPLADDGTERWTMAASSGEKNGASPLSLNKTYRLCLRNDSDEWHPMHLHRHTFELIRYRNKPTAGIVKDTVVVPPYDEVQLLLTPRQSGPALFHCHNQMHMDAGLQTLFTVEPQRLAHNRTIGKS
jgi:FtsP/CotA-like multicopper oxidase with cupredoxin domain